MIDPFRPLEGITIPDHILHALKEEQVTIGSIPCPGRIQTTDFITELTRDATHLQRMPTPTTNLVVTTCHTRLPILRPDHGRLQSQAIQIVGLGNVVMITNHGGLPSLWEEIFRIRIRQ